MQLVWRQMEPCPFCGSAERQEHGGRVLAGCVGCGSLERHRAIATYLGALLTPHGSACCLELGPRSSMVFGGYLAERGWQYTGADRWDVRGPREPWAFGDFVRHDADASDLAFARSGGYELFITQHVIEQVPDYPAALDEVARVLEPGGRAIMEIPWKPDRVVSERGSRDRHGAVWMFGADLVGELEARFARVDCVELRYDGVQSQPFICWRGG